MIDESVAVLVATKASFLFVTFFFGASPSAATVSSSASSCAYASSNENIALAFILSLTFTVVKAPLGEGSLMVILPSQGETVPGRSLASE